MAADESAVAAPPLDYRVWREIEYSPKVDSYPVTRLIPFLPQGARILDVGCGPGGASLDLARRGFRVCCLEINEQAARRAKMAGQKAELALPPAIVVGDAIELLPLKDFDAILLVRLLTCLPALDDWRRLLDGVRQSLTPRGYVDVHDFLWDPAQDAYRDRYDHPIPGDRARKGNFAVHDRHGRPLFVAHHHTPEELAELTEPYECVLMERHEGLSMHANRCSMFEFIGRLKADDRQS